MINVYRTNCGYKYTKNDCQMIKFDFGIVIHYKLFVDMESGLIHSINTNDSCTRKVFRFFQSNVSNKIANMPRMMIKREAMIHLLYTTSSYTRKYLGSTRWFRCIIAEFKTQFAYEYGALPEIKRDGNCVGRLSTER